MDDEYKNSKVPKRILIMKNHDNGYRILVLSKDELRAIGDLIKKDEDLLNGDANSITSTVIRQDEIIIPKTMQQIQDADK